MTELESRTICIDLDQTLCSHNGDYENAEPISDARQTVASLRQAGWIIVVHTARHFNHWHVTVDWLARHKFEYDQIVFGKPPARFYIDDRAIAFNGDWKQVLDKIVSQSIK
jgi:hypothetical protein